MAMSKGTGLSKAKTSERAKTREKVEICRVGVAWLPQKELPSKPQIFESGGVSMQLCSTAATWISATRSNTSITLSYAITAKAKIATVTVTIVDLTIGASALPVVVPPWSLDLGVTVSDHVSFAPTTVDFGSTFDGKPVKIVAAYETITLGGDSISTSI